MSGARRTDDFNTIKSRQLILQNPDGTYPEQGSIMTISDQGRIVPSQDITVGNVTVEGMLIMASPPLYQDISAISIVADNITTRTLDITDTSILSVFNLSTTRVETATLTATNIFTDTVRATGTSSLDHINSIDISAIIIDSIDISVTNTLTAPMINATHHLVASDISASYIAVYDISAEDISADDISANTIHTHTVDTDSLATDTMTVAGIADISGIRTLDISASKLTVSNSAFIQRATIPELSTSNFILTGDITLPTGTVTARVGNFGKMDISQGLVNISGYFYNQLEAAQFTGSTVLVTSILDVTGGSTFVRDISATNLTVNGSTKVKDISGTSLYVTGTGFASTLQSNTMSSSNIQSDALSLKGPATTGILTYNDSSGGLLVNGSAISSVAALLPSSFSRATKFSDLSATVDALVTSYNSLLELMNGKKIIVVLAPSIRFNSTCTIQFQVNGVVKSPITFEKNTAVPLYSAEPFTDTVLKRLNDVGAGAISFTINQTTWAVTMHITGSNNKIADISGMPTGSLQVLRYLGFTVDTSNNVFETYALSGTQYVPTFKTLTNGYSQTGPALPPTVEFLNNLETPTYDVSNGDPYALSITFTNLNNSKNKYLAIQFNGSYVLYPTTVNQRIFSGLTPNTAYPVTINYLDLSNNSTTGEVTFTTPNISPPTDLSTNTITFNSFRTVWSQPYSGKAYRFLFDVSGRDISGGGEITDLSKTFFPLHNDTDYFVRIRSRDVSYNSISAYSPYVKIHTEKLIVPTPEYNNVSNSNISKKISWTPPVPTGVSGELYYSVNRGTLRTVNLSTNATYYNVTDLSGVGDISSSLHYTDNSYNDISGAISSGTYDVSFGFIDMSANAPFIEIASQSGGGIINGVGFVLPDVSHNASVSSPWIGYTFNRIIFPTLTDTSGTPDITSIRAEVYDMSGVDISGLYTGPSYNTDYGETYMLASSSLCDFDPGQTLTNVVLTFATPIIFTKNKLVLIRVRAGDRSIRFPTFDNSQAPLKNNNASPITYTLSNGKLQNNSNYGDSNTIICQFDYI